MAEEGISVAESETLQQILNAITGVRTEVEGLRSEMRAEFTKVWQRFDQVDAEFAKVWRRFDQVDAEFAKVHAEFAKVWQRFDQVDAEFAKVWQRFDRVDAEFAKVWQRFDHVDDELREIRTIQDAHGKEISYLVAAVDKTNRKLVTAGDILSS